MTRPDRDLIAIDVGQTGTRVCVVSGSDSHSDEVPLMASPGAPLFADQKGTRMLMERIARLARTSSASIAISLSGFDPRLDYDEFAASLSSNLGARRVVVASDAFATAIGSLGDESGVSVTWGTGVVALASNGSGMYRQIDGRGYLLGDGGGGSWVGRHGIIAGLDFADRRGESQCLGTAIDQRFKSPGELFDAVYSSANPASLLASFVPHVFACERAGDDTANRILVEAAEEVFSTVTAAWSYVESGSRIVITGGMTRTSGPHMMRLAALVRGTTGIELETVDGAAMTGALAIAARASLTEEPSSDLYRTFVQ